MSSARARARGVVNPEESWAPGAPGSEGAWARGLLGSGGSRVSGAVAADRDAPDRGAAPIANANANTHTHVDAYTPTDAHTNTPTDTNTPMDTNTPTDTDAHADVASSTAGSGVAWRDRMGPAVRERMPLWLQSRCGLERKSVAALTVLLVVAAVFAVQHFWVGRTQSVRAPEVVRAVPPYGGRAGQGEPSDAGPDASAGAPSPVGAAGTAIVVDVSGKVRSPGLQRLPSGSRVADALRAAGGVRPGTNTDGLNRARLLMDGEQIVVGAPAPVAGPGAGGTGSVGTGGSAAGAAPSAPVALNTATVDQLDSLPGVGPVLAQHIIDYRTQHGGFRSVDELREVNGIGDRRFSDLRNLVRP
ncbi:helix-hairpin-helix domain-containing protein [Streptomyces sp. NPDC050564]|uniref:helix-hairpin-helix domain-containing protein n=1 Tax=Streptomyces sp. NPDC050564 TaxID=3365631 RepID=UPI00379EAE79